MLLDPPKTPWLVQVLTLHYLIDGYLDSERDKSILRLMDHQAVDLPLASVQFQPAGNLTADMHAVIPWTLISGENQVAILPRDPAAIAYAMQNIPVYLKQSFQAEVYSGPYVIRGRLLCSDSTVRVLPTNPIFPMLDVEVTCLLPGSKMALKAPYLMVLPTHKELIVPAEVRQVAGSKM